jgi:hypothetical protein
MDFVNNDLCMFNTLQTSNVTGGGDTYVVAFFLANNSFLFVWGSAVMVITFLFFSFLLDVATP